MALLACSRYYWQAGGAAQESIGKSAQTQQVIQRADQLRIPMRGGRIVAVRPLDGDERLASIRQNENELQASRHAYLAEDLQRESFEGVMRTGDGHPLRKVLMMGSL
jgi:hypothetical protein